jgi:hypothetical protein
MSKLKRNSLKSLYQFYYGHLLDTVALDEISMHRVVKTVDEQRVVAGYPLFSNGTINLLLKQVVVTQADEVQHE